MKKLLIIGGGEIGYFETEKFDKRNVELTGKKNPKVIFLPTANENKKHITNFHDMYEKHLKCDVEVLYLLENNPPKNELKNYLLSADLIYIGGGNTLKMMRRFRYLGVDKILKKAYEKGVVISGLSAGGIAIFESGHSDSMSEYKEDWKYINVTGIGLLEGIHCPHFDDGKEGKSRKKEFMSFMKKYNQVGIAIDNECAIEVINDKFKIQPNKPSNKAYKVYKTKTGVVCEEIPVKNEYMSIDELYSKKLLK